MTDHFPSAYDVVTGDLTKLKYLLVTELGGTKTLIPSSSAATSAKLVQT